MKRSYPKVMLLTDMKTKNTKELLGYLSRLRKCEESFEKSDMDVNIDLEDDKSIYFKQTDKWKIAYNNVKAILANREHIKR